MLIYFVRFLFGYLQLAFSGEFCERILNLAAQNRVTLWDIKNRKNDTIEAKISIKNFKNIRAIRAKSGIRIKVLKKVGLPFILKKHSSRIGFAVGFVVFILMLNFLSGFVWKIEVAGNEKISSEVILSACEELGISEGVKREKIDYDSTKEKLMLRLNGVAWASLNVEGCRLTVEVSEIKNNTESNSSPSDLFAKVDGVIKHVNVQMGNCLVKVGDAVVKGDMLVSGTTDFKESGVVKMTQSKGEIIAQTKRVFKASIKKTQVKNVVKNTKTTRSVFSFFGIRIPLYLGEIKQPYNAKITKKQLKLFNEKLPISIVKKEFFPLKKIENNLSEAEALELGKATIKSTIENSNFVSFALIESKIVEKEEEFVLTETYNCEENIVYEVKMQENILQ